MFVCLFISCLFVYKNVKKSMGNLACNVGRDFSPAALPALTPSVVVCLLAKCFTLIRDTLLMMLQLTYLVIIINVIDFTCELKVTQSCSILFFTGSHVSTYPSLNFLLYVPKRSHAPLFVTDAKGMYMLFLESNL